MTYLRLEQGRLRVSVRRRWPIRSFFSHDGARSERFDFLAYLLAMALREVRRLVQDTR